MAAGELPNALAGGGNSVIADRLPREDWGKPSHGTY